MLVLLAGCGAGSAGKPNGIAGKTPAEIDATARAVGLQASSVDLHGSFTTRGGTFLFDLRLVRGRGGLARLSKGGQDLEVIRIGSSDYIRDSGTFFKQAAGAGAPAAEFPGKWLKLPVECTTQFTCGARHVVAALTDMRVALRTDIRRLVLGVPLDHPRFVKVGSTRVAGQPVVGLKDVNAKDKGYGQLLYVAATGRPYPVEVKEPAGTSRQHDIRALEPTARAQGPFEPDSLRESEQRANDAV